MSKEKNNVTLKVFAFIIALVLWSYVMSEVNPDRTETRKNINVTLNNIEELDRQGLIVMNPKEVTISVEVTGKSSDMANFSWESIKAQVDLSGYSEGEKKVPVNVTLDNFSKVKITGYEPKEILFTFDKLITKEKPITIKTAGTLDTGYVLGEISTKSQSILLKGPRTWVNEVAEVVAILDIDGRKEDGSITTPILLLNDQGNDVRGVEKEPKVIDVSIPILRTKKVPIELQIANQLPENFDITEILINPSTIEIKGNEDILNLKSIQTKPLDINDLVADTRLEIELDLPQGVELLNSNRKITVSLKIEESMSKTFSYSLRDLNIENLDKEFVIDEEDYSKDVEVTLKGNKEDVENLIKEDLQPSLDLGLVQEGLNKVYIKLDIPTGMTIKNISPQPIEVRIIKSEN